MLFKNEFDFLSNFFPCEIVYEGMTYQSSEAAYQAAKTLNKHERRRFTTISASTAKKLGRKVSLRKDWDNIKVSVMKEIVQIKFSNPELMNRLLEVEGEIIEDNWWGDKFWGKCNGEGENHLGIILMEIRDEQRS